MMLPETRFVIVAGLRTGSTLLAGLLDCHPDVHCEGELLVHCEGSSPGDVVAAQMRLSEASAFGFHFKLGQAGRPADPLSRSFLYGLHAEGWRIIHVHRRNIFRQAASAMIAQERRVWHDNIRSRYEPWKVQLDAKGLVEALRNAEVADLVYRAVVGRLPHLRVTYEDELLRAERHQSTADRVFDFLQLPRAPVTAPYRRSTPDQLADCVANFDEIVQAVRQTRYARFLDDPEHG